MSKNLKKSLPAIAIFSTFIILNNLYLFSQYRTINSFDESLTLFAEMSGGLAIIAFIGLLLNALVGWLNFKKAGSFQLSLILNAVTTGGLFVSLLLFDIVMNLIVSDYFVIMTAFAQTNNVAAAFQIIPARIFSLVITFGFLVLASFITNLIFTKKSSKKT